MELLEGEADFGTRVENTGRTSHCGQYESHRFPHVLNGEGEDRKVRDLVVDLKLQPHGRCPHRSCPQNITTLQHTPPGTPFR